MARNSQQSENQTDARSVLQKELDRLEKSYGKGSVIYSNMRQEKVDVISTGSLGLDIATGIRGIPRAKVTEIIGWESSGKSTITIQTIAKAQELGLKCLLVDGENSFDATYAKALGVDTSKLLIVQLDQGGGERAYNIADSLMRTKEIGLVVFDSQTSLLPKKAMEEEIGVSKLGLHARLMSESVPKIVNAAAISNAAVIYISQLREKIGVMFGSPETTSGGNALRFYAHMRIEVRKSVERDDDGTAMSNKTKFKIIKNKLADPFKEGVFYINFGKGIDKAREIFSFATELGIILKADSWYSYQGTNIGQGEDAVLKVLNENPEYIDALERLVLAKLTKPRVSILPPGASGEASNGVTDIVITDD